MSATDQRPLAVFLMGPTAAGKTDLATYLADRFPLDLISVDSALVYRGLDIGSAKPDAATLVRYPHALIDIRNPDQPYSAAEFRDDAQLHMQAIAGRGRVPLLVGGTGLYFRALQAGLSNLPGADARLRASLAQEARTLGWPALHQRLRDRDPVAAGRIGVNDTQRLQRALEVIELTGRPLSDQQGGLAQAFPWRVLKLALIPADRAALHARIALRMDSMLNRGFLDEVRRLRSAATPLLHSDLPSMRAVGYRQAWQHLDGAFAAAELRDRAIFATRQLAKRQLTWLRCEMDAAVLDPLWPEHADAAARRLDAFLTGP